MSYPREEDFKKYVEVHEQAARDAQTFLSTTELPVLERLTLKLAFIHNRGVVTFPATAAGRSCQAALMKLSNELFSFCAALRAGSLYGAWHHLRGIIEVNAALFHIFADAATSARRANQFVEYDRLSEWKVHRRLQEKAKAGTLEPDEQTLLDQMEAPADQSAVDSWIALYGVSNEDQLAKLRYWHKPSIRELLDAMNPSGDLHGAYQAMCQPTHFSPTGHRLTTRQGPTTLGYDSGNAVFGIRQTFYRAGNVLNQIEEALGIPLLVHFEDEFDRFEPYRVFMATGKMTI
jgi:hypothetical protein